jgi:hypothetical protein
MTNTIPPAIGDATGPNFIEMQRARGQASEAEKDAFDLWLVTEGNEIEEPEPIGSPSPATIRIFDELMACD